MEVLLRDCSHPVPYLRVPWKCRVPGPTLDLLSQNLYFNKIPRPFVPTAQCEEPALDQTPPMWSLNLAFPGRSSLLEM